MSDISSDRIKELLSDPKNLDKIAAMVGSMSGGGLSALLGGSPGTKASDALPAANFASENISPPESGEAEDRIAEPVESPSPPAVKDAFAPAERHLQRPFFRARRATSVSLYSKP